jgi:plasmid stability protein
MTTMTLRGVDDTVAMALKERARREDTSVNTVMLGILKEALGIDK